MRGRPPKPTALKLIQGNPGKRPLNELEPKAQPGIPDCPAHLDDVARAEWDRIMKELAAMGLLAPADRATIAGYCTAYSLAVKCEQVLAKVGPVYTKDGMVKSNPAAGILLKALSTMQRLASELGLSPASRTRIHTSPAEAKNEFEQFLSERNTA
jgi:P27 family predicted phage terminase small subunit